MQKHALRLAMLFAALAATQGAGAQQFPTKPIRIVTSQPGSGNDLVSRIVAEGLTGRLASPVIVDNRGVSAAEVVARATPDGYTLLLYGPPVWLLQFMRDNVPWDPVKSFAPVTLAVSTPNILVVHPSVAAHSMKELIGLARAQPGKLNYGSTAGASTHLAAELFKSMAGVDIVGILYKGAGPALNALVGGEVQLMFPNASTAVPHVKAGRLRALAVATQGPSALVPGLPTISASGLPGYEAVSQFGIFVPTGTPKALLTRLHSEIVQVLNTATVRERLSATGVEVVASSSEALAAAVKSEIAKWGPVIRNLGIRE